MYRYWLLLLIGCCCKLLVNAQALKEEDFDHYTKANGLSDNYVTGIAQDSTGYLWIATQWGLNRFNGYNFVQFHAGNDSNSLAAEDLRGITWLDKHRIAISGAGLHIQDTRTGQQRNVFIPYHDKKYQFKFNMQAQARGNEKGDLFILNRSGFYHFDSACHLVFRLDHYRDSAVAINHFYFGGRLLEIDDKQLLIVSSAGLFVYDKQKRLLQRMTADSYPLMAPFLEQIRSFELFQVRPGEFFIFKSTGSTVYYINLHKKMQRASALPFSYTGLHIAWQSKLVRLNDTLFFITGQQSGIYPLTFNPQTGAINLRTEKILETYLCTDIMLDNENRLIIGTNKGLLRQKTIKSTVQTTALPAALNMQYPTARFDDIQVVGQKVYAATRGAGLAIFDKQTLQFEQTMRFTQFGDGASLIRGIAATNDGTLLLGTAGLPLAFHTGTHTTEVLHPPGWIDPGYWSSDVYRDSKNNIWISASTVYRFKVSDHSFDIIPTLPELLDVPTSITEDRRSNIWFACHGVARYNTAQQKFDLYIDSFPFIKMPDKQAGGLAIDDQNRVWFGSYNNGVVLYDPDKKSFRHFTKKEGLPDNVITGAIAVGGQIWVACYSGIACIDTHSFEVTSFGKEDGFPTSTTVNGARFFYDSTEQQLYVSFTDAIARFSPLALLQKKQPPAAFIESIVVNGKEMHYLPQALTTSWKDKSLTITIGTINFHDGATQRYAYRFADTDSTAWTDLGNQASFNISQLSPGNHRLQVKVFSSTNRWPEQVKEMTITISPPLWLKPWFLVMLMVLLLWLIYLFVRWRSAVATRKEMVNTQIEKLRAEDYKAQFELEQITSYFSSSLSGKKTEEEVLWDVAANLIGRMNYEDCIIYRWNKSKTRMVQKAAYGPKGKQGLIGQDGFDVAAGQGVVGHVIATKKPLLISDTRKDDRYRIDDAFRLSELAVPIIHNNELLGVIDSENSEVNYFSERDIKILTTIATLIGNKLTQLEFEQSLEAKKRELAGINEQLAEARLSALQAQMNPHFVFNALNTIKGMILEGDNDTASRYLSKFALMIRMTLEHSKETFVTLQDNMQYLKAYLDMEKLRFNGTFTYQIEIDDLVDPADTLLPSMMIQPLVENAIWHGLMHSEHDKKLNIFFRQEENRITCIIEDNGIGIRQSEILRQEQRPMHRSVGLENLQKRIKMMNGKYNTACSLRITDLKEAGYDRTGTKAELELNLITT